MEINFVHWNLSQSAQNKPAVHHLVTPALKVRFGYDFQYLEIECHTDSKSRWNENIRNIITPEESNKKITFFVIPPTPSDIFLMIFVLLFNLFYFILTIGTFMYITILYAISFSLSLTLSSFIILFHIPLRYTLCLVVYIIALYVLLSFKVCFLLYFSYASLTLFSLLLFYLYFPYYLFPDCLLS